MIAAFTLGLRSLRSRDAVWTAAFAVLAAFVLTLMLGLAAQLPAALRAADHRADDRYPANTVQDAVHPLAGHPSAEIAQRTTVWHGQLVNVIDVADPTITPPPGVVRLPSAGDSIVSPRLARLMRQPTAGRELRPRVGRPIGQIHAAGLRDPEELFAYVGMTSADVSSVGGSPIAGWGMRQPLITTPISPLVAIPLAVVILVPSLALAGGLLRLDAGRRERRIASVGLLGGGTAHLVAIDLGFLLPSVVSGWLAATLLRREVFGNLLVWALHGRFFFAGDLDVGAPAAAICLLLLAALIGTAAMAAVRPQDSLTQAQTVQPSSKRRWGLVGCVLCLVGFTGALFIASSDPQSQLRTPMPFIGSVGCLVIGVLMLIEPLALGTSRV